MRSEFQGTIGQVREIEDAIRVTRKYTEGLSSIGKEHPAVIQSGDFPSKAFSKCYEIYPDTVVDIDMAVKTAINWLWADTTCINVRFWYDYRSNRATFKIIGGDDSLHRLLQAIPGMLQLLTVVAVGKEERDSLRELAKSVWIPSPPEPVDMSVEPEEEEPEPKKTGLLDRLMPMRKKAG